MSLDEVTLPTGPTNATVFLVRSIPFFSSNEVPWNQVPIKQNGTSITGFFWETGNSATNAGNEYSYLVPPYLTVVNDTIFSKQSYGKRSGINQYSPGYISYSVQQDTFLGGTNSVPLNGETFPVTTRTARYQITVTGYTYLSSSNFLRVSIIVGVGSDGNGTLSVTMPKNETANSSTDGLPNWVISESSADWTIVLPQNLLNPAAAGGVSSSPVACEYDPSTQIISAYLPYAINATTGKSPSLTYTLFVIYEFFQPSLPSASVVDGGGPKLLPLWIVLGVVGGLIIIGIIAAIIVAIIIYKVVYGKIKRYELEEQFDKTEGALGRDRTGL